MQMLGVIGTDSYAKGLRNGFEFENDERSKGKPVVEKEILRFRRGQHGSPWKVLDFSYGELTVLIVHNLYRQRNGEDT